MKQVIQNKANQVEHLAKELANATSILVFEYHGANTKSIALMRKDLHSATAKMYVAKNNIFNRAFKLAKLDQFGEFKGPNAIIVAHGDEIIPFKQVHKLMQTYKQIVYKTGIINRELIAANQLAAMANIPSRSGLLSMLLSCLQAPTRNLAYGIKSVGEKLPQQ